MPDLNAPCFLYRFFDGHDQLLYVGISEAPLARWKGHSKTQPWWNDIDRIEAARYDTRGEAESAELAAIRFESPRYNIRGAKTPAGASTGRLRHLPRAAHRSGAPVGGAYLTTTTGRWMVVMPHFGGDTHHDLPLDMWLARHPGKTPVWPSWKDPDGYKEREWF